MCVYVYACESMDIVLLCTQFSCQPTHFAFPVNHWQFCCGDSFLKQLWFAYAVHCEDWRGQTTETR